MQYVVVYGDAIYGFSVVGPFNDREAADIYVGTDPSFPYDLYVAELHPPAED